MKKDKGISRKKFLERSAATAAGLPFLSTGFAHNFRDEDKQSVTFRDKSDYTEPIYEELPLGSIKPKGWLLNQLEIMRDGTTGHLDEVYAKIRDDNGWLGGEGDSWEETPYWLDGAVPLAYLLDDQELKEKVLQYINWVLENQRPSGYFGPITKAERENGAEITPENGELGEDWWPKMIMLKVLKQYYTATKDARVLPFMSRYFEYQLKTLEKCPLGHWTEWAESRGADNAMIAQWLYGHTGEEHLLELAALIESQAYAWSDWFGSRDWVIWAAYYQGEEDWLHRHAVNVSMALRSPAISYQRTGDKQYLEAFKTVFEDLMTLHGLPMGIFSGDEDLHGNDPSQGVELCAIVESMFSLEKIIAATGDVHYMDALERMAFNAFPPQTTDDFNAKQYFQIANQVQVKRGVFNFSLPFNHQMNNVYGMRSGYTCCLANMHQGWPKFTEHLWYKTKDNGLAALIYSPNTVVAKVGEDQTEVKIDEETIYPFDDTIRFMLSTSQPVTFPLQLRVPAWCEDPILKINGQRVQYSEEDNIITLNRNWKAQDTVTLKLPMEVTTSVWGRNSRAIERGPLVYGLNIGEEWEKGHHPEEGDYWSVYPEKEWNYGLIKKVIDDPETHLEVDTIGQVTEEFIWNLQHAPIQITAPAKKIPEAGWSIVNDVAPVPVTDRYGTFRGEVEPEMKQIALVPFGCTKLRVVAFPVVP